MLHRPDTKTLLSRPTLKRGDSPDTLRRQTKALQDMAHSCLEICSGYSLFGADSHHN